MKKITSSFRILIAIMCLFFAIVANVNAQKPSSTRSIDIASNNPATLPKSMLSGIWYSSQSGIERIVVADNDASSLLCKWYFKNGHENKYVLTKIATSNGQNAKSIEKSIDFQAENEGTINVYEYRYGENERYIGTLIIKNGRIVEIDEDRENPQYFAQYEWWQ